jgi:hypothetical protein
VEVLVLDPLPVLDVLLGLECVDRCVVDEVGTEKRRHDAIAMSSQDAFHACSGLGVDADEIGWERSRLESLGTFSQVECEMNGDSETGTSS